MLIIEKLKSDTSLSKAEKSVANKMIELQLEIENISIRELAKLSYTSTSAITRLCHKMGFEGYNELKKKYLEEVKYLNEHFEHIDANIPFHKDDNVAKVLSSIANLYQETAKDTLSLIQYYDMLEAVKLLEKSRHIYVLCMGSSLELGKIFAEKMARIGVHVTVSENFNEQYYQSYNSSFDDCFIIISYSGTILKIQEYIDNIKRHHAKSILITSLGESDLKKNVDVSLTMTTRERLYSNISSYSTIVSTMLLLDMLYSLYFYHRYDYYFDYKKELAIAYESCRKASHYVMEENDNNVIKRKDE